jgi:hypothetical protein
MCKLKYVIVIFFVFILVSNAKSDLAHKVHPDTTFDVINFYSNENPDTVIFRKIGKDVPAMAFNIILNGKDYKYFPVKNIIIRDSASNQIIHVIESEKDSLGIFNIEFNDFNFDGYKDLYVYDGCAILANCFGKVYLYNKDLKRFVRDYAFDDLTSVQVDKDKKIVRSFNRCCAGSESDTKIFRYYNGKLTLIKEILMSYNTGKSKFIYIVNEYNKDGKLIKSKEVISDDFDLDLE